MEGRDRDGGARLTSLDVLRGFAACAVMLYHYTFVVDIEMRLSADQGSWFQFPGGHYGVQLFFVISGFVILWSLQRVARVGQFSYSRFSRLYPPFWGALAFTSCYLLFAEHVLHMDVGRFAFTFPQLLANITMVPEWFAWADYAPIDPAWWSLAVELTFYVFIGIAFLLGLTRPHRIVPTLAVVWCLDVAVNGVRFLGAVASGHHGSFPGAYNHLFIAGMALYLLYERRPRSRRETWILRILLFGAPIIDLLCFEPIAAAVTAGITIVMWYAIFRGLPFADWRPLRWLGAVSYSVYLLHTVPGYLTIQWLVDHGWDRNLAVGVAIVQTFLLAYLLNRWVEKPVTGWLKTRRQPRVVSVADAAN